MAQKENQRIALTKKLLQEGLLRLLEQKTLDRISVTELCRESGINRATFYNHYNSPLDLLDSIESKLTAELERIIGTPRTTNEVTEHTEAVCAYFHENARTILILHNCHADTKIANTLYKLNQDFQQSRLKNKYTGTIRPVGLHLITVFFYTGCYNLLLEWLEKDIQATPKEIAELMITMARENFVE